MKKNVARFGLVSYNLWLLSSLAVYFGWMDVNLWNVGVAPASIVMMASMFYMDSLPLYAIGFVTAQIYPFFMTGQSVSSMTAFALYAAGSAIYPAIKVKRFSTISAYGSWIALFSIVLSVILASSLLFAANSVQTHDDVMSMIFPPAIMLMSLSIAAGYITISQLNYSRHTNRHLPVGIIRVNKKDHVVIENNLLVSRLAETSIVGKNVDKLVPRNAELFQRRNRDYKVIKYDIDRYEYALIVHDVTELTRQNQQLKTVAYAFRHDVANHLTVATTGVQYIESEGYDKMAFSLISDELSNATTLLRGLSEWSAIIQGASDELEVEMLDLECVIKSVSPHDMEVSISKNIGSIIANRGLIQNVFRNMLENARKYCVNTPCVQVSRIGNVIFLQDNAGGFGCHNGEFDARYAKMLLQPNQRGENNESSGTGLGLAIAVACLSAHNFQLTYQSECSVGTLWSIHLS